MMLETILRLKNLAAVVDIIIVATILYWFMLTFKGTKAERMIWGLAVVVIVYFVSLRAELITLHWILSNFLGSIVVFIIVVFQQDIRRALVQVGRPFSMREAPVTGELIDEVVKAVASMARDKTGAIIAIERTIDLTDLIGSGVELDARLTRELLLSVFNPSSPLHDGAVVVRRGRAYMAGCILPLTEKELEKQMGTRHRAALGLSEEADAAIIVVSEETGEVTLVIEEKVFSGMNAERLQRELRALFSGKGAKAGVIFPWQAAK